MKELFIFFAIIAIISIIMTLITVYFCIVIGSRADKYMDKIFFIETEKKQTKMICLDCGEVFNMKEYEVHCCCPKCLKNHVEIIKEK